MRILVALVAILASTGVAQAHDVSYDSAVTIDYGEKAPRVITHFFNGKVKSSKQLCEGSRTVKVFHKIPGADELVGSVETAANGRWSLGDDTAQGRHYARVVPRDIGIGAHDHICEADDSRVIVL
ncbi:MAG: hypothetical protein QOI31_2679 [Solirubrobacterales bacterium]|jgi:hypothetical protein|nr:hypothetical protein [Solirubrobacterales bacterium]